MKVFSAILVFAIAVIFVVGTALAVPPGKTLTFPGGAMGDVTFSGAIHAKAGLKCMDCHTKIFPMKPVGAVKITMADIYAGKYCGTCHNGSKAFAAKGNCTKCHHKK
ncbi:MAG: cytochrome c3 family protein [Nitrospiraceae bacterium]|nr:cytochrome c3 family protein [Nitrospiraceae bacterium]